VTCTQEHTTKQQLGKERFLDKGEGKSAEKDKQTAFTIETIAAKENEAHKITTTEQSTEQMLSNEQMLRHILSTGET
jgi:hypothetical protein